MPATGFAGQPDQMVTIFATCTGRFSALIEHQWLMGLPGSEDVAKQRANMEALLFSTMPKDAGRAVLAQRIDAKFALAALLTRATFGTDPREAAWAADRAQDQIGTCNRMLLG